MPSWRADKRKTAERGYGGRWQKARETYLASHPLCVKCQQAGRIVAATVVDHVKPHRGDMRLFWDKTNWQSLCATHHSSTKQAEERSGVVRGCDIDGRPLDPAHPWYRPAGVR